MSAGRLDVAFTPDGNHFLYSSWSDYSECAPDLHGLSSWGPEVLKHPSPPCHDSMPFPGQITPQVLPSICSISSWLYPPYLSPERFLFLLLLVHICNIYGEETHTALDLRYWLPLLVRLIRNYSRKAL